MPFVVALILWLFTVTPAYAEQAESFDDWREYRAQGFRLYSDADPQKALLALQNIAAFREVVLTFTGLGQNGGQPPLALYWLSDEAHWRLLGERASEGSFLLPTFSGAYLVLGPDYAPTEPDELLLHDYVEYLLRAHTRFDYPWWYSEGLAEFFAAARLQGGRVSMGTPTERVREKLEARPAVSLATVFATDAPPAGEGDDLLFSAWALVHYFMLGPLQGGEDHRAALTNYLELVNEGTPSPTAFNEAFDLDYTELEERLQNYMRRQAVGYTTEFEAPTLKPTVQVMPPADATYRFADLLLKMTLQDAAEPLLQNVVTAEEPHPEALARLAIIRGHRDDFDQALAMQSSAVAQAENNPDVLASAAHVLSDWLAQQQRNGEPLDEKLLARFQRYAAQAAELDANDVTALMLLGRTAHRLQNDEAAALRYYVQAWQRMPWHIEINFIIGQFLAQSQAPHLAPPYLKRVIAWDHDGRLREKAQELLDGINSEPRASDSE